MFFRSVIWVKPEAIADSVVDHETFCCDFQFSEFGQDFVECCRVTTALGSVLATAKWRSLPPGYSRMAVEYIGRASGPSWISNGFLSLASRNYGISHWQSCAKVGDDKQ